MYKGKKSSATTAGDYDESSDEHGVASHGLRFETLLETLLSAFKLSLGPPKSLIKCNWPFCMV